MIEKLTFWVSYLWSLLGKEVDQLYIRKGVRETEGEKEGTFIEHLLYLLILIIQSI